MKKLAWYVAGLWCAAAAAAGAEEAAPLSAGLDLPVLSAYVWRGQALNDKAVVQPSLTVGKAGLALNTWANYNIDGAYQGDFSEVDLTASYSRTVGPVALGAGVVQYTFPNQTLAVEGGEDTAYPGTAEVFGSVGLPGVILAPTLTVSRDVDAIDGTYGMLAVGHTLEVNDLISLAASASLGAADADYNAGYFGVDDAALNDLVVGLALPVKVRENLTIKPAVSYVYLPDADIRDAAEAVYGDGDAVVGSLTASYAF